MVIDFREITVAGLDVAFDEPLVWLDDRQSDALRSLHRFPEPFHVEAHLERSQDTVLVHGRYAGVVQTECVRCLKEFTTPVEEEFRLTLLPHTHASAVEEKEKEVEEEDVDLAYFDEEKVDLTRVVSEQVILSLDLYPRCRPDCRGLCPVCGKNLNEDSCRCEENSTDTRLSALKQFKLAKDQ